MTKKTPKVLFSINCYEKDYEILNKEFEFRFLMCDYPFAEVWMTVLNVSDEKKVAKMFKGRANKVIIASEMADEALAFFNLNRDSFKDFGYDGYKYSIASIIDLYLAKDFDYICHFCSDVGLVHRGNWITTGIESIINNCVASRPLLPRYSLPQEIINKTQIFSDHIYLIPVKRFRNKEIFNLIKPEIKDIHPKYGGNSFERRMTRYMMATNTFQSVINKAEEIHPCYFI